MAATKLIERNADVNAQSQKGLTPLHVSLEHLSSDVYFVLVVNGADETIADSEGRRPLDHHFRLHVVQNGGIRHTDPGSKDVAMVGDEFPSLDDLSAMDLDAFNTNNIF